MKFGYDKDSAVIIQNRQAIKAGFDDEMMSKNAPSKTFDCIVGKSIFFRPSGNAPTVPARTQPTTHLFLYESDLPVALT